MKKILLALIATALTCIVPLRAAVINGILVDATDTTELMEATVRLVKAQKDSAFVKGTTTDLNGVFNLKGIKPGKYVVKFSYMGYNETSRRVTVGDDGRSHRPQRRRQDHAAAVHQFSGDGRQRHADL